VKGASDTLARPAAGRSRLRPVPARWFELLTAREDLTRTVETLARTGSVELETHSESATPLILPDLRGRLEEYHHLAQRFHAYWPQEKLRPSERPGKPVETLERALDRLYAWREEAEPLVHTLEEVVGAQSQLTLIRELLQALQGSRLQPALLARSGPALATRAFVLPPRSRVTRLPAGVIVRRVTTPARQFLLTVGPPGEVEALEQELALLKGRALSLPEWLGDSVEHSLKAADREAKRLAHLETRARRRLERLEQQHRLHEALGSIARLEWFLTHVEALPASENFAWVTGWTSDLSGNLLQRAVKEAGVRAVLRFPPPPREVTVPMVFHNPRWAQPFELFARLLGTPAEGEADPSRLLVFIVPLLFGYMFGDVGQGAVLLLGGLLLARRLPALRLLIPAGLSAMLFGLLFGSVFSHEDLIPPLWLNPLEAPLLILGVPLFAGVLLLLTGLLLNGVEAYWRHALDRWWRLDLPLLLLYLGLAVAIFYPDALWAAAVALPWFLIGHWQSGRWHPGALLQGVGVLLESSLQLLVNTLSFSRVGAFALAHAGLSATVVALADIAESGFATLLIMVLGNMLIILLEGLVVSIQITRLVLFEFFIRFLRGEGRPFRPLAAPNDGPAKTTRSNE